MRPKQSRRDDRNWPTDLSVGKMSVKQNESLQGRKKAMRHATRPDLRNHEIKSVAFFRPSGALGLSEHRFPPLKRWAIFGRPCGTKHNESIQNQLEHYRKMTSKDEIARFSKSTGWNMWNRIWSDTQPSRAKEHSPGRQKGA